MFLIFDTETTGLPKNYNAPVSDSENWPRLVQLAWQLHDERGELIEVKNFIVKPEGFTIPFNSEKIHGISTERALKQGVSLEFVLDEFNKALAQTTYNVGHNIEFDLNIVGAEFYRTQKESLLLELKSIDTKNESTDYCAILGGKGGKFKWPTLTELHQKLFNEGFNEAHNASADVEATARCFLELIRLKVISPQRMEKDEEFYQNFIATNPDVIQLIGLNIQPYSAEELQEETKEEKVIEDKKLETNVSTDLPFAHLHNHTQFSVLQSTTKIGDLVKKAVEDNMPAIGLTDHANMMGTFVFVKEILAYNTNLEKEKKEAEEKGEPFRKTPIKPIVGCEFYVCDDRLDRSKQDNGYQIPILAKNKNGYHNLIKLASKAYTEGFYYVPRIDKKILSEYKEDLIVLSGGLYGEVTSKILNIGDTQAEEALLWWKEEFGDDFYLEINRHNLDEENHANKVILNFAEKHQVKYIAANNTYYLTEADANAHDILLCVKDGEKKHTPIGRGRGFRYGFPNNEFYFKSQEAMRTLFADLPEAIETISEIIDKVEPFPLKRDVLLPKYDIPEEFEVAEDEEDGGKRGENKYLRHLTYEGAKKRYEEITPEITERLDFELQTIENTGYPGYFLIVQDFTSQARKMNVSVGPGRGSAAGSAVAYCIGITNVDPIKYDLLFERFLNPDRVSLPDIDIDFDDEGRGRVIDYVINKYGANQVAQIITYGSMAAKSSIRDTARVLDLPLSDADRIAKLVPDMKLNKMFNMPEPDLKKKLNGGQWDKATKLKEIAQQENTLEGQTLNQAIILEGSLRNTGVHACGVIITPDDITNFVPVATAKDSEMAVTQFDNAVVESAGMLKMDFLGLKTLTIIKDAIALVEDKHNVKIDADEIPLDDEATYELYQRGETNGTFQFESPGMQKHLRALKPDKFDDLIAMNALYRPGPMEYIPNFIARKHGREEIAYDIPIMEKYLKETYGITVFQEQVMLLSQQLAGFTKGKADVLRKAMGKKIFALLEELKPEFLEGCQNNGHDTKIAEKIWKDWEAFAAYAFNKSHSTCYSLVAYQTAYLKANYPAEYMAAVLTNNMSDIKKVSFFMEECKRMKVNVLGPDVNESAFKFKVNDKGEIRFGLGAIKGVGEGAVESIVNERTENGPYSSYFDFIKRIDLRAANKKCLENLVLGGGMDSFNDGHRAQFFMEDEKGIPFLEKSIKFANSYQTSLNSSQQSLFGNGEDVVVEIQEPPLPICDRWGTLSKLAKEREVVGIYISGHPLDDFKLEIENFATGSVSHLKEIDRYRNKEISIAGIVSNAEHRISKKGNPFGSFEVEDYSDAHKLFLFGDDYLKMKHYLINNAFVFIKGKVQPKRWSKEDEWEYSISSIELLNSVREKLGKSITFNLSLDQLNESFIEEITSLLENKKGKCRVNFKVIDETEQMKIDLPSKSVGIDLTDDMVKELEEINALNYVIK